MFGFLKKKLKDAVKKFSSSAEKEVKEKTVDDTKTIETAKKAEETLIKKTQKIAPQEKPAAVQLKKTPRKESKDVEPEPRKTEEKTFLGKLKERFTPEPVETIQPKKTPREATKTPEPLPKKPVEAPRVTEPKEATSPKELTPEPKPSFLGKLKQSFTQKTLSEEKFHELFWDLELAMLENNVAVEVIEKIKADLKDELTTGKVNRLGLEDMILTRLRTSIEELLDVESFDLLKRIKQSEKPYVICMIGVNGSGKTTSLAKVIHLLQEHKLSCVVAASDTFRAAAIDQLREHTDKLGVKLISQGYHADPAAVAFDAIKHAKANKIDVVLIDTAGRLHSNTNLMQELEKVVRVNKPNLKIFVGESITGNDCVEQAKVFDSLVGIDAIILSKADVDEKGGAAISVSYVTGKPILYLGTGQTYDDLVPFEKEKVLEAVGL